MSATTTMNAMPKSMSKDAQAPVAAGSREKKGPVARWFAAVLEKGQNLEYLEVIGGI